MKDIRRKCNRMMNLSKFTSNKKILSGVITLVYNQVTMAFGQSLWCTFVLELISLSFMCVCLFLPKKKSLLPNFVQIPMCNYVGPKKIKGGHNFFLKIKNHKFFKFIYNNNNFFPKLVWSYDHLEPYTKPLLMV